MVTASQVNDRLTREINDRATETRAIKARLAALEAATPVVTPPAPVPVPEGRIVAFQAPLTAAQVQNAVADTGVGTVKILGTVTPGTIRLNVNRATPLLIDATAATIKPTASQRDAAFEFGYAGQASGITLRVGAFDGYTIGSTGIVWCGNAHDLAFSYTVRNSVGVADPTMSWGLYLSYDDGVGASDITVEDLSVLGSGRRLSGIQIQYAALHRNITIRRATLSGLAFALYAKARTEGLLLEDIAVTDSGVNASSVYLGDWTPAEPLNGRYSRISIDALSKPLLKQAPGMVAA